MPRSSISRRTLNGWTKIRRTAAKRTPVRRASVKQEITRRVRARYGSAFEARSSSVRLRNNLVRKIKKRAGKGKRPVLSRTWRRRLNVYGFRLAAWGFILILAVFIIQMINPRRRVTADDETVAALRVPHRATGLLEAYAAKHGVPFAELFTLFCAENDFFPEKNITYDLSGIEAQYVSDFEDIQKQYDAKDIEPYYAIFENLFGEVKSFPILETDSAEPSFMYGDSWGIERNYEGDRTHRGADIQDRENVRGRVQVVSMTDGLVKDAGWDDDLGYNVGVVTPGGTYFLYAHLDSIAPNISPGAEARAGMSVGHMGDSGGAGESFPVHLHIGISPQAEFAEGEFWINPYPFLRYIESPTVL